MPDNSEICISKVGPTFSIPHDSAIGQKGDLMGTAALRRMTSCWAIAFAIAVLMDAPVFAQSSSTSYGLYSEESSFKPDISSADVKTIERVLGLRSEESAALAALYNGYEATLRQKADLVRAFVRQAAEEAEIMEDSKLLAPAHKKIEEWSSDATKVKKQFLDDLKSLLTKDQEERWPILERELRRFKSIGFGRLAGESIDLTKLTAEVLLWNSPAPRHGSAKQPAPEAGAVSESGRVDLPAGPLGEVLNRYTLELDRALIDRERAMERLSLWNKQQQEDPPAAKAYYEEVLQTRKQIQDVNRRYVRLIGNELSPEARAELEDRFFRMSYTRLFRPKSRAEETLEQALKLDSLTGPQLQELTDINTGYQRALKFWRSEAASLVDKDDEELPVRLRIKLGLASPDADHFDGSSKLPENHPVRDLRRRRLVLDRDARQRAEKILTPEQLGTIKLERADSAQFANWSPWQP